mmetsp:Transcript_8003/g.15795  ORF Transcript_8003/g.15795 Transcript_8003/m.15795 type:complete len:265 (-) Transcript_8003:936-1730(-)
MSSSALSWPDGPPPCRSAGATRAAWSTGSSGRTRSRNRRQNRAAAAAISQNGSEESSSCRGCSVQRAPCHATVSPTACSGTSGSSTCRRRNVACGLAAHAACRRRARSHRRAGCLPHPAPPCLRAQVVRRWPAAAPPSMRPTSGAALSTRRRACVGRLGRGTWRPSRRRCTHTASISTCRRRSSAGATRAPWRRQRCVGKSRTQSEASARPAEKRARFAPSRSMRCACRGDARLAAWQRRRRSALRARAARCAKTQRRSEGGTR